MDAMLQILQILLSWQFITLGLATYAIVAVLRKILEYLMQSVPFFSKESSLWNGLVIPIAPFVVGPVLALCLTSLPYPAGLTATIAIRFIFGLVAGSMSGLIYRVVKTFYGDKLSGVFQSIVGNITSKVTPSDQSSTDDKSTDDK